MSLTFNATPFRSPTSMSETPKVVNKSEWRSVNNSLTTDILDFASKKEFRLGWKMLSETEFNTLMGFVDTGQIPVISTIPSHSFNFALASVSLTGEVPHTYNGYRINVEILIREA